MTSTILIPALVLGKMTALLIFLRSQIRMMERARGKR
jgi:hypothetical protein